jgi:hypothetical protein
MSSASPISDGGRDLLRERGNASFPVSQMFEYLSGSKEKAAKILKFQQIIEKDPVRHLCNVYVANLCTICDELEFPIVNTISSY